MVLREAVSLLALSLACSGLGAAQTRQPEPRLAIEFQANNGLPPTYSTIQSERSVSLYPAKNLHAIAGFDADARHLSALGLAYKLDGDQIHIVATAYYGDPGEVAIPAVLDALPHETLATYTGRLDDSITLTELERVGFEPITLKIVAAQSEHPYTPAMRSEAPSLAAEFAPLDRNFGTVTVHNESGKAVIALRVGASSEGNGWATEIERGGKSKLVGASATERFQISPSRSGKDVDGAYVENPPAETIVLQAAVFADFSFEGDRTLGLGMAAAQLGHAVERQRIVAAAEPILADGLSADPEKVKRIVDAVNGFPALSDAEKTEDLRSHIPDLTDLELPEALRQMQVGIDSEKHLFDGNLKQFETGSSPVLDRGAFGRWWAAAYKGD